MDVSLSTKPQTLTLISCFPLSSSSSYSFSVSSSRFCSLQREFLGCGHRLRLPGLYSRRKCKKLGFQIQSPRFLIRASLFSQPIYVIIAVATFSALTVVFLNYTRRKKDVNELSSPKDLDSLESLEMSKQAGGLPKKESRISDIGKLNAETPMIEIKSVSVKTSENGHAIEEIEQYRKTASMHEETLIAKASDSPGSDILAYSASGAVSTKEKEDMGPTLHPLVFGELGVLEPVSFAKEMPELLLDGHQAEAVLGSELARLMVEPASVAAAIPVNHVCGETNRDHKRGHGVDEAGELQVSGYNGFFRESVREELYTFYEENHSGMKSLSNFSLPNNKSFSSQLRPNMQSGAERTAQGSHHTSGQMPLACYNEGSSSKRKNFSKGGKFRKDMGKGLPPQNGQRDWPIFPRPNGSHASNNHDSSKFLNTYNRLLRDGRLTDCIELLESMEQRGLLDMDKIYHVKFFNTCKSQTAVKEAFRFTKLIGNPTLSTFNMLLSVCASSQDSEGAFQVLQLVKEAGLKVDCKLYTTLISTCAKCGKVDAMFEVFHEMVNGGVEPNVHTYGALIDGCARAGQVAKAFGAYGILRSKKVKPDRVVFNALITACGQSGAVDRAFDVLAEMGAEPTPVDPDHFTVGALIKTCTQAGQFDRARKVYKMIHQYNIKGTPEVYTIAVNSCSQMGDLEFALSVYGDMTRNGVVPDEMFLSALIDVAGHAGKIDVAFKILQEARIRGTRLGNISYSSLMGACSNAKNWQKAMELYEDIKAIKLRPTVSTLNALITALCNGGQLQKAVEVLAEMKKAGVHPNTITYSILLVASEKNDELEVGFTLHSQAKKDDVAPNLIMYKCLIGMCLWRFDKAYSLGECVLSFKSGKPQVDNKWTSSALTVYREAIAAGIVPTMEFFSLVLACLQFPRDSSLRARLVENLGVSTDTSRCSNLYSLIDGFGEYDPRSFSLFEEAASLGIVPCVSFKESPIVVDTRKLQIHTTEVYLLTILKGLKHRLAAGARLPNLTILLPIEKTQTLTHKGGKIMKLSGRVGQAVGALLRRLGLPYQGNESYGKIRINGLTMKHWFQPKLASPFSGKPAESNPSQMRLGKGIIDQQRNIRTRHLSLE